MVDTANKHAPLSPRERAMIASGRFDGNFTPQELLDRMRHLTRFDAENAATLARVRRVFTYGILLALAGVIGNVLFQKTVIGNILPAWLLYAVAALGVSMAVAGGVLLKRHGAIDIADNFHKVALPFLALLKQDMEPDANLQVRIDLRDPRHENKRRPPRTLAGSGGVKTVETTYHDAWFHGSADLADGSSLTWDVDERIVDRTRTKRSRSNKLKTKSRSIKHATISVALTVANDRYGVTQQGSPKDAKFAVRGGDKRSTIKLVRKIKSRSLDSLDPRVLLDTVSSAYQRLAAPARSAA